jgi:hypothetical protein
MPYYQQSPESGKEKMEREVLSLKTKPEKA